MSQSTTFAEFLASIGFKADEKSLKSSLTKVAAFGVAAQAIALGVCAGVMRIAQAQVDVAKEADQLRTSTQKLEELKYMAEQTGASAEVLGSALKGLVDKHPRIKDSAQLLDKLGQRMQGMTAEQQKMYAKRMGIDPTLIPMLTKDVSGLKNEFAQMYAVAGTDAKEATEASKGFLAEIGKLKTISAMLAKSVGLAFIGRIRGDVENLRRAIMENFGAIKKVLELVIGAVLRIAGVFGAFAYRAVKILSGVVLWFDKLDDGQKKMVLGALGLLAAWKLLNLGFLATPLGMLILGLTTIVGLIDDYLTFMEGGESKIDWSPYVDTIEAVRAALGTVVDEVGSFISRNGEAIMWVGKSLAVWLAVRGGINGVSTATKLLAGGIKGLGAVLKANIAGIILYAIIALLMLIIEHWDTIKAAVLDTCAEWAKTFAEIAAIFQAIWQSVVDWFSGLWDGITESFPDFGAWAQSAVDKIKAFFGPAIQWLQDKLGAIVGMWDKAKGFFGGKKDDAAGGMPGIKADWANLPELTGPALVPSPSGAAAIDAGAASNRSVELKAKTEIHVHGVQDPQAVGAVVAGKQDRVNADMVRHTQGSAT